MHRYTVLLLACISLGMPALGRAGHSRFPYLDGGQSQDGRFVVTAQLIEHPAQGKKQSAKHEWKFTWLDKKTDTEHRGQLQGLRSGTSNVFEPVHGHIFVAPDGETFAVWNPQALAPTDPSQQKPPEDRMSADYRRWSGFTHRLVVYRKAGEVVKQLDLHDFLKEADWEWLYVYGRQVYWQLEFPGLTRDNSPRVGYALYQVSPDYTVLEVHVGANAEAARKAAERGIAPSAPRKLCVDLTTGRFLEQEELQAGSRIPRRPFVGAPLSGGRSKMSDYVPSLDPVRVAGSFQDLAGREPNAKY